MKIVLCLLCLLGILAYGCSKSTPVVTPSLSVLSAELRNVDFRWSGPCSREDRIPVSHAARALAYIGDDAVPVLLNALDDSDVRVICIYDALSEIGIPVYLFRDDIMNRDSSSTEQWWIENAILTVDQRSEYRRSIGLPAIGRRSE